MNTGEIHSGTKGLVPELQEYSRQFAAIKQNTERLLEDLTEPQLTWREDEIGRAHV